jgi:hypothetical protein
MNCFSSFGARNFVTFTLFEAYPAEQHATKHFTTIFISTIKVNLTSEISPEFKNQNKKRDEPITDRETGFLLQTNFHENWEFGVATMKLYNACKELKS